MSSYHYAVRRFLGEVNKFINVTLRSESLSKPAQKERDKILELLLRLYADYDSLSPSGDEGSTSSARDTVANAPVVADESRNTNESSQASEEDNNYSDNIPDTTVKALNNPVKIGYLEKKTNLLGVGALVTWKKCYCVLHKNILYSFKKPDAKKQDSAFFITGYEFREAPQLLKDATKKDGCFELVCPGKKSYQFLASSKEDLQAWKDVISATDNQTPDNTDGGDENNTDDIYEEFTEPVPNKQPAIVPEVQEDIYDDGATDAPSKATTNQSPSKATSNQSPIPVTERPPLLPPADDNDDMIYEAVSETQPPPPVRSLSPSVNKPVPSSPTPPLPRTHDLPPPPLPNTPRSGSVAPPLPSPPADAVIPPPLPSRNAPLPPPPKEPLPEIPKAKNSPTLAKMIHPPSEDFENMFYGRWKCDGSSAHELSFNQGEIIHVISRDLEEDNWWVGELGGKVGLVPKAFLTPAYELVH